MSNNISNGLQGNLTPEQQHTNEEMQFIAVHGQEAWVQRKRRELSADKELTLRDDIMKAVLTGIYANPNRAGTCVDAVKTAYEVADAALIQRLL